MRIARASADLSPIIAAGASSGVPHVSLEASQPFRLKSSQASQFELTPSSPFDTEQPASTWLFSIACDAIPAHPFSVVVDASSHVLPLVAPSTFGKNSAVVVIGIIWLKIASFFRWQLRWVCRLRETTAVRTPAATVVFYGACPSTFPTEGFIGAKWWN
jgi:hypothetical protein